jgi:hypothetical protein
MNGYYGVELNVEETKVIRISKQPSPVQIIVNKKKYLSSEIKSRFPYQNQHSTRRLFSPANWT